MGVASAQSSDSFSYEFAVDEDGFTVVNINYTADRSSGSSWVLVPRFSEWTNRTVRGEVTEWYLRDTDELTGEPHYFYEALSFSFRTDQSQFEMDLQFNLSVAAMIIEPDGIFYSPQIGFEQGRFKAKVILPDGFDIKKGEAVAYDSVTGRAVVSGNVGADSNQVVFDNVPEGANLMRIEVGFKTLDETPESLTLESGVFAFETVSRYEEYARGILALFNETYEDLVGLFNVTLESAEAQFFLPDFNSLFAVGGYVPFVAERMGDIHINLVFTRYVEGYIEVIALHELVHHFLWKAGISPGDLLWFHEGMAQYVSIETANKLGYEGSSMMKEELEQNVLRLKSGIGEDFGFLTKWSPSRQPPDMGSYYIAAYCAVTQLAENRGGLDYYIRFFREINGETVDTNAAIGYYLSLAADESVVTSLNSWGFGIPDLYLFSPSLQGVEEVLDRVDPVFQPYKFLAEVLYRQAFLNAREDNLEEMQIYLAATVLVARLAPVLTLITVSGILFGAVLLALRDKGVFSSY